MPIEYTVLAAGTVLAVMGWFIRTSMGNVNNRLDELDDKLSDLDDKLDDLIRQVVAIATKQDINNVEIERLRVKLHEIDSEVVGLGTVQARCGTCNRSN